MCRAWVSSLQSYLLNFGFHPKTVTSDLFSRTTPNYTQSSTLLLVIVLGLEYLTHMLTTTWMTQFVLVIDSKSGIICHWNQCSTRHPSVSWMTTSMQSCPRGSKGRMWNACFGGWQWKLKVQLKLCQRFFGKINRWVLLRIPHPKLFDRFLYLKGIPHSSLKDFSSISKRAVAFW